MKRLFLTIAFAGMAGSCFAQGLVKFSNNGSTLISWGPPGGPFVPTPPGPTFYYAFLTAPLGTTDPTAFTFAGIYATNSTITTGGRLQGGSNLGVPVAGWAAGESRSFEVAGWSADGGTAWNSAWLTAPWSGGSYFAISAIGQGFAGGTDTNGASIPPMAVFGAAPSISSPFVFAWIPEPTTPAFTGLGLLVLWFAHARNRRI